jgi:3-dehydroquinate dehydratase/shikimate dehydrogenase
MICVAIGRSRHKHIMAEHQHLVEQGAKMVELRLDYIAGRVNIRRLLAERPEGCQVIITCRRKEDGGKWGGSEESRMLLLREAIAEGVDYVDLEEDVASQIPRFGRTKRIISYHNFRKTPEDLRELHDRMSQFDPDVVKIAAMANDPHDNVRMLEMMQQSEKPTVGMCMGDIGTPSRILAGKFGAPFTYATFHHERTLAPGQLSFRQMNEIYRYERIKPETAVFGVIADPVGHSLSPHVHNAAFEAKGIDAVYVPFRVPADALSQFMEDAPRLGIRGLSVTIPHKEAIARHLTKVDPAVKSIAAVNTVVFDAQGVIGYNTDYNAAMDCLEHNLGTIGANPSPLSGKRVLVLGAGGVARPIVFGLKKRGASTIIASRTLARAERLAHAFEAKAVDWEARHRAPCEIIINCTPIGMHPNVDESPIHKTFLKPSMLVFDTVYNPETTLLIKEARNRNGVVITGVEMFVRQAMLQFFLFTRKEASAELMREVIMNAIGPVRIHSAAVVPPAGTGVDKDIQSIGLIGYRGTGKTAVSKHIAKRLGWDWVDVDGEVELLAGKTIAEIFAEDGEAEFRRLEASMIADLSRRQRVVLGFGGGAVLREDNRQHIASCGAVVWLQASAESIAQRLAADPSTASRRPNLTNSDPRTEIDRLLEERTPIYRACATLEVDTEGKAPEEVAGEIVAALGLAR